MRGGFGLEEKDRFVKFEFIHDLVLREKIDIICLQETHLKHDKNHKDVIKFEKIRLIEFFQ